MTCDHPAIKLRRSPADVLGVQDLGAGEPLELVLCPGCGTTVSRPTEDARHLETAAGEPACGSLAEGALVVDEHEDVTCFLCLRQGMH